MQGTLLRAQFWGGGGEMITSAPRCKAKISAVFPRATILIASPSFSGTDIVLTYFIPPFTLPAVCPVITCVCRRQNSLSGHPFHLSCSHYGRRNLWL